MKKLIPVFAAIGLIAFICCCIFGFRLIEKYTPSKEMSDLVQFYGTKDGEAVLFYNYERLDTRGICENGQNYLPLSWVNENLNKRFYWDDTEKILVYALPDRIVYADADTCGSNGAPLLLRRGEEIYLLWGLVANYTDIQIVSYEGGGVNRIFINDWGTRTVAALSKNGKVRELGGIKSPILTEVDAEEQVTVLESLENWSRVYTPDGHIGYIQNRVLEEPAEQDFQGTLQQPVYNGTSLDEKVVLVWHQVTNQDGNRELEGLIQNTKGVNVVAPTWFSLTDNEGNYSSLASADYVETAHSLGLQVWALLDNFSSDVKSEILLSSTARRRELIQRLMADVDEYDLDGLNMDFEGLKESAGVHYIQFLRELSIPCRERGIVLSVDNYVPADYNAFYDREEQGVVADYVIVMGYDEHTTGDEPGSNASLEFVRGGIERTLESVPKEKLIDAVPFYTRVWTENADGVKNRALGIAKAKSWVEENQIELYWQPELGQYYGEYGTEDEMQYVWMEEETSLAQKMELIKKYDLAGVACWKLGLEDSAAWDAVSWN